MTDVAQELARAGQVRVELPREPAGVLAPDGTLYPGARVDEPPDLLLEMYRWMVFGRAFDTRLFNLQRQGRLTVYAPIAGQEACQVGCGLALRKEDWLLGSYRDGLAATVFGRPAELMVWYFTGHPKTGASPQGVNVPPLQVSIGEQISHAVGVAWGMKLRGDKSAALAIFGDGATSEGAFHEACNFAGVMHAPAVLFCQNNGWAISVPRAHQTASETIAQKALAYGITGILLDGNDVLAVYREVRAALERARSGAGPMLIEALTYRFGPHTTSDDPTRYRPAGELETWQQEREPIRRLRAYLERQNLWDERRQAALEEECRERIASAVTAAMAEPPPAPEEMFEHIFAEPTPLMREQRSELLAHLKTLEEKEGGHA